MSAAATPEDLANGIKLLERLRTGELNVIPSIASLEERKQDASTAMLQRVEAVLRAAYKRVAEPVGTGGPAFPMPNQLSANGDMCWGADGMTLRDYFAAKAMQGLMANPGGPVQASCMSGWSFANCDKNDVATLAYVMADAMLGARAS